MIKNIIVISDTHSGCQLALCPPKVTYDGGGKYVQSSIQEKLWEMWLFFVNKWIPEVTKGEDYILVHNGDCIDGVHHGSTSQISHNIQDQRHIAVNVIGMILKSPRCKKYYHIRGTEAHVGKSAEYEEMVARELGAIPDDKGNHARWEMWLRMGKNNGLIHFSHHIGTTSSASYESTAVYKELVEAYTEAGKQGLEPPDIVVRSHRHRYFKTEVNTSHGYGISVVTPAWQLKTPFVHRLGIGRASQPQIGGILIREGEEDGLYTRAKVWHIGREKEEII